MPLHTRIPFSQAQAHAAELRRLSADQRAQAKQTMDALTNPAAKQAYARYLDAVGEMTSAGAQVERDMSELASKRAVLSPDGYQMLRDEAKREAEELTRDAHARAKQHLADLKDAVVSGLQPSPADTTEARATLQALLTGVRGPEAMARLADSVTVAPEAMSILGTEYGRAVMFAAGINPGREQADITDRVRLSLAASTPEYRAASDALGALDASLTPIAAATGDLANSMDDSGQPSTREALHSVVGRDG